MSNIEELKNITKQIRTIVLKTCHQVKVGHIGSAFSIADILAVLYFNILKIDPQNPTDENRDRLVLSKGHACSALYATMVLRGFFEEKILMGQFHVDGGMLHGHPVKDAVPGIEVTTGSLGQGFSTATGIALAAKKLKKNFKTFIISSDGECNEGQVWEAVLFAAQQKLDNLVAIIDYNHLQAFGTTKEVLDMDPFAEKFKSFGWQTAEIDGHNFNQIIESLSNLPKDKEKPTAIIAKTIKGKGVSFMENKLEWHYKWPTDEELVLALKETEQL